MEETKQIQEEIDRMRDGLRPEYLRFIDAVLAGTPKDEAYYDAGLSVTPECSREANELWDAPKIQYLVECHKKLSAVSIGLTVDQMVRRLSGIAMTDVSDVVDAGNVYYEKNEEGDDIGSPMQQIIVKKLDEIPAHHRAAISSIKPCKGGAEVKLHDKTKVMEMLIKHLGGFTEKQEVTISGGPIYTFVGDNGRGPKD
jgi:hypothetical protein